MEFTGEAIDALSMDGRFTMANMAIEAGAKAGIFQVDNKTLDYVKPRQSAPILSMNQIKMPNMLRSLSMMFLTIEPQVPAPLAGQYQTGQPGRQYGNRPGGDW